MKAKILRAMVFLPAFAGVGSLALAGPAGAPIASGATARSSSHSMAVPAALRPVLYRSLAKDSGPAYAVNEDGCAVLQKQGLKACFDARGAHFTGAATPLSLHLVAYGRGGDLASVTSARPRINDNRVRYAHGSLTEWWRVLPLGFEQGFTLAKRPDGHGELTLALAANEQASERDHALAWGKLRYGKLVVTDAHGKVIPATLKRDGNRILIAVNDKNAAYPLTVDPLVWLEQKVTASDGTVGSYFGFSVALSGNTALIGAAYATVNGNTYQGAAYIFTEANGVWAQTQKLTASDGTANDGFGLSVALDGTMAVVGADQAFRDGPGAAYVFSESNGTWTQTAELAASNAEAGDYFGAAVALSGTTALVGAYAADVNGNDGQGAAYVFTDSGGNWIQTQKLTASDGAASNYFGQSVALDGATALIGAPRSSQTGLAYIFTRSGGTWTQAAELSASDGTTGNFFGLAVTLDGASALIGAPNATVNDSPAIGAAYVFSEAGGTWAQTAKLTPSDGAALDSFGVAVALRGTTAMVGADWIILGNHAGAAYVFNESGGTWTQAAKLGASDGATGDSFGYAIALEGSTALIGSEWAVVNGNQYQGAAYFYGASDLGLNVSAPQTVDQGQQYVSQAIATNNASAASPAVSATITVPAAASFVSATATQGGCSEGAGVVTCDFGPINGNAGTATANVTFKATGNVGDTIENIAGVAKATPPLSASAPTTITAGGACPEGYTEYDGNLNPGEVARSPVYQAPSGQENAILTAPADFELYAVYQSGRFGRHVYRVPGNEMHRWGPKGLYMWLVRAHDGAGSYTLCLQHP